MYYVYLLKSLNAGRYYVGHTAELEKRLVGHNNGKTKSTKGYMPWEIVYIEKLGTKSENIREKKK